MGVLDRALRKAADWAARIDPRNAPRTDAFDSLHAYEAAAAGRAMRRAAANRVEAALATAAGGRRFRTEGYCCVCRGLRHFEVDFAHGFPAADGWIVPNWREWQVCAGCGMNSRLRAAADVLLTVIAPPPRARIYAQEQVTPFFRWLSDTFSEAVGSEYLGTGHVGGRTYGALRHEDATALSFPDASIDHVVSFEVFEHIPDYGAALREVFRVLKPGGSLLLTVPFLIGAQDTLMRAVMTPDGSVRHLEPPEYHGNPINPEAGSLCFHHFGWDLLDRMRESGAARASVIEYTAPRRGCLGPPIALFLARKG